MQENTLFSGKIYTAGTNFTRTPVATVVTNLNSANTRLLLFYIFQSGTLSLQQIYVTSPFRNKLKQNAKVEGKSNPATFSIMRLRRS